MNQELEIIEFPLESKDERGWMLRPIYNVLSDFKVQGDDSGLTDVKNLHVVSAKPGVIRGEHFHKLQMEFLLIIGGEVEIKWQNPNDTIRHERVLDTNYPQLLRIPPNVVHSIKNVSKNEIIIICYSKAPELQEKDSYKVKDFHDQINN